MLLGNQVGSNLEITVDRNIGVEKLLCVKTFIAQGKSTTKSETFHRCWAYKLTWWTYLFCCNNLRQKAFFGILAGIDLSKEKIGDKSDGEE